MSREAEEGECQLHARIELETVDLDGTTPGEQPLHGRRKAAERERDSPFESRPEPWLVW